MHVTGDASLRDEQPPAAVGIRQLRRGRAQIDDLDRHQGDVVVAEPRVDRDRPVARRRRNERRGVLARLAPWLCIRPQHLVAAPRLDRPLQTVEQRTAVLAHDIRERDGMMRDGVVGQIFDGDGGPAAERRQRAERHSEWYHPAKRSQRHGIPRSHGLR